MEKNRTKNPDLKSQLSRWLQREAFLSKVKLWLLFSVVLGFLVSVATFVIIIGTSPGINHWTPCLLANTSTCNCNTSASSPPCSKAATHVTVRSTLASLTPCPNITCPTTPTTNSTTCSTETVTDQELLCIVCRPYSYIALFDMHCQWPQNSDVRCKCLHMYGRVHVIFQNLSRYALYALNSLTKGKCKVLKASLTKVINFTFEHNCFPSTTCSGELFIVEPE